MLHIQLAQGAQGRGSSRQALVQELPHLLLLRGAVFRPPRGPGNVQHLQPGEGRELRVAQICSGRQKAGGGIFGMGVNLTGLE